MISTPSDNEDIDFEPEEELGDIGALKAKLKKLKDELEEVKKDRQEYLDGWQRAKADMVNAKREVQESLSRAGTRGKEILVEELIPALDGFDLAMEGESWNTVDATWRAGIESIKAHIEGVLKAHGVEIFGKEGDMFDPNLHEAIQEVDNGTPHTIAKVFRRGYRTKERILRPAQIAIFK
ncbi:MAG: nucleotide exchange factor GrpE [Patescibacteria group bacterium]